MRQPFVRFSFIGLCMATILAVVLAFTSVGNLYRLLPHGNGRYVRIANALEMDQVDQADMVLLGNSATMCIDAELVAKTLAQDISVWNMATTGQRPVLSYWLLTQLDKRTHTAVIGLQLNHLQEKVYLAGQDMDELLLLGFDKKPMAQLIGKFEIDGGEWLTQSASSNKLQGRLVMRKSVNFLVTQFLRKDLNFVKSTMSLYYPNPYREMTSKKPVEIQERSIRIRSPYVANKAQMDVLLEMVLWAKENDKKLFFYIQPGHPRLIELVGGENSRALKNEIRDFCVKHQVGYLEIEEALHEEQFYDLWHLNSQGANVFAKGLGSRLKSSVQ